MPLGDTLHTNTFLWKEVAKQFPGEDLSESLKAAKLRLFCWKEADILSFICPYF